ncbi:putative peptide-N(4)-(N-acetyl-beta-glucosaminyl)asparagine amidase [Helianthus debilis subsp. tardiflorus]
MTIPKLIILILSIFFTKPIQSTTHFIKSTTNDTTPKQYFEVTHPLPTDNITPSCSVNLLNHTFSNTTNTSSVTVNYTTPPDTCNWSIAVLQFQAECKDEQYDRIAGIWINGIELLRTSTAQPTENGSFWNVRKDEFGDEFYSNLALQLLYPYNNPADSIVPISASGGVNESFWFRIEDEFDVKTQKVQISNKTYKAVLELYVSFHGNDESWYMNPSDSYVETNHLSTGQAHGAYREVLVTIDGKLVGAVVPFPVISTRGINRLFWDPVVSIGAFNLPSYDIDLTPFLGILLDEKNHTIGIKIADGISFWLVDANLHLWFDKSNVVKAKTLKSNVPTMEVQRSTEFELLDGEFEIQGERESKVTGWVYSSAGNLQTQCTEKIKFKSKLKYKDQGTKKELDQKYKRKTRIKITNEVGKVVDSLEVKFKYPLKISIETKPGLDIGTSVMTTKVVQERSERFYGGKELMVLSHKQNCTGLVVVKGSSVLSGSAETQQNYNYNNGRGCYSRVVDVVGGVVVGDDTSSICVSDVNW